MPSNGTVGTDVVERVARIDRRMVALAQLHHSESKLYADRDGTWTIPMLRAEIRAAVEAIGLGEAIEALRKIAFLCTILNSDTDLDVRECCNEAMKLARATLANLHPITSNDGEIPDHG